MDALTPTRSSIPLIQPRGNIKRAKELSNTLLILYTILVFCLQIWKEEHWSRLILVISSGVLVLHGSEMLNRVYLLVEESFHVSTRYCGDRRKLLIEVFQFNNTIPLGLSTFTSIVAVIVIPEDYVTIINIVIQAILNSVLPKFLGQKGPCAVELSSLTEKQKLNVGHGMAWSYYFGFLKLILPDLPERIKTSISPTNYMTVVPKLFILLPESCYAYASITEADSKVQHMGKVPFEASRAGNIKRPYPSNVYSVESPTGQIYYCAVEYATPLLSLYEMSESPEAGLSSEGRLRQMLLFYTTLSNIMKEAPACGANCVLVPYKDRTPDGDVYPVSILLAEAIEIELKLQRSGSIM